jgi:hypothetical protein
MRRTTADWSRDSCTAGEASKIKVIKIVPTTATELSD